MIRTVLALASLGFVLAASGCAAQTPRPGVHAYPTQGQTAERMARDRHDCERWAIEQTGFGPVTDTAKSAGLGAAIGALTGAAAGAAIGAATGSAGTGAAVGAAAGGIGGAGVGGTLAYSKNRDGYDRAYAVCMEARGYKVR